LKNQQTYIIEVKGLVQGVGFRPFIYRVALSLGINGTVENRNDGVFIKINANDVLLDSFIEAIKTQKPLASFIEEIHYQSIPNELFTDFSIVKSTNVSDGITDVSPDIAVCDDCLQDLKTQTHRLGYPFINCTNCGPRFTIIKDLPYDRPKTSMQPFDMCKTCYNEYTNIFDRRFHAQPVACNVCGPQYSLHQDGEIVYETSHIIDAVAKLIHSQKIVAIKGLGGFFIACDALSEEAVSQLRNRKQRESKPFAVMFAHKEALMNFAFVNKAEEEALASFRRPIVLLKSKNKLAASVCMGFNTLGAMLPYMPFHYQLFDVLKTPAIVLTSGNISDEPIIIDNSLALQKLKTIADAVLTYNRDIHNRADDSVLMIANKKERIFRRSRGYAPTPFKTKINVDGILATGAELVNCFCIGKDYQAIMSQHIGDLKNIETYTFYTETIEKFKSLFRFKPTLIVSDMHPNYLSTRYATESQIKHIKVQHHHAHIAACMAEYHLNEKVIGVSFDGTGYGTDGHIWGSEFFVCDLNIFNRVAHFEYMPMPGGDKVTEEPWRMAVSYLYTYLGADFFKETFLFLKDVPDEKINWLCHAMDNKINCPLSCSAGRLFDAVAALLNVCTLSRFHAEAPMRLEALVDASFEETYTIEIADKISFKNMFLGIMDDLKMQLPKEKIAAKFHNTLVSVIVEQVCKMREIYHIDKICLSGGTFQNKYLLEKIEIALRNINFEVFIPEKFPVNDAGIALGQLYIGALTKL